MFNISDKKIKNICALRDTYDRGLRYHDDGRVRITNINEEMGYVEAKVSGSEVYSVTIEFSSEGEVISADCECPAYYEYEGYCKHIAAVLIYLKDLPSMARQSNTLIDFNTRKQANETLSFFENRLNLQVKEPINIEMTLETFLEGLYGRNIRPSLSMKIGDKRLYVVKSIKSLVRAIDNFETLDFGKNFSFDPHRHTFYEKDMPVIEFIREMYEIEKVIEINSNYGYGSGSLFKGKYLYLSPLALSRFLRLMEGRSLNAYILGMEHNNIEILKQDIPVDFILKKSGNELLLNVSIPYRIVPLTPDGSYIFADGKIYNTSKDQRESLAPFYQNLTRTGKSEIRFSQKDREKFVSLVIPSIKKAGNLSMEKDLEGFFYERPLEAKLFLDKSGDNITVSFEFRYGDYTVDPFNQDTRLDEKIIIRDYEKERKIINIFEVSGFKINKEMIYLDDDNRIYNFIMDQIPVLQEMGEVYYSEAFRKIRIYDSAYCVSSVHFNEESDLLEFSFSVEGIDRERLSEIFASIRQKRKYYRLPDGSYLPLDNEGLNKVSEMIQYLELDEDDFKQEYINISKFKAMYLDNKLKEIDSVYVERNSSFKKLVENIRMPRDTDYTLPQSLKNIMRGYQITGFKWLKTLSSYGLGGILADDMGLGKTLQAIAFIMSEKEKTDLPSIVVCPTSLVYNWESEILKFAPSLKSLVISGSRKGREDSMSLIGNADIVITSYPLIRRDIDCYKDVNFSYCILDEAQHIKNPGSINARSVKEIRAKGYFALTGTPIENNLTELWSVFDFLMPGYLLSHGRFVEKFEKPVMEGNNTVLTELNNHIRPFILRRLKKDVLNELPPKIESTLTTELTGEQKEIYLAFLEQIKGRIENEIKEKGFQKSRIQILAGLTRLRQICCDPSMFIENYDGGSSKMDLLMELLEELREGGHRILLFSQFTTALHIIKSHIEKRGFSFYYLDGSIKAEDRSDMVKCFNQGKRDLFLISLKAGGTGLNLTGADTVVHFDPWWNPAVEDQAADRAYRIGQKKMVQVMKLITKGTIEEKIFILQQKKRDLINSVLQPGETFISKMNEDDIRELFNTM